MMRGISKEHKASVDAAVSNFSMKTSGFARAITQYLLEQDRKWECLDVSGWCEACEVKLDADPETEGCGVRDCKDCAKIHAQNVRKRIPYIPDAFLLKMDQHENLRAIIFEATNHHCVKEKHDKLNSLFWLWDQLESPAFVVVEHHIPADCFKVWWPYAFCMRSLKKDEFELFDSLEKAMAFADSATRRFVCEA